MQNKIFDVKFSFWFIPENHKKMGTLFVLGL
jgi:hypothetical protein